MLLLGGYQMVRNIGFRLWVKSLLMNWLQVN